MDTCKSDYTPAPLVLAFHNIPHLNISFASNEQTIVTGSLDYFESVIIWSCLPLLVGLVLFIVYLVYNCLICCCCCPEDAVHPKGKARCCAGVACVWLLLALTCLGGLLYVEVELNRSLNTFVSFVEQVQQSQDNTKALTLDSDFSDALSELQVYGSNRAIREEANKLQTSADQLLTNLNMLNLKPDDYNFFPGSYKLPVVELARHWTVIGFLIMLGVILLVTGIALLCCKMQFLLFMLVAVTIFMIITWFAVALGFAGTMVLADFCTNPETTLKHTQDPSLHVSVDYYLVCKDSCNNTNGMLVNETGDLYKMLQSQVTSLKNLLQTNEEKGHLNRVELSLDASYSAFQQAPLTCDPVHASYEHARKSVCGVGFIYMLTSFGGFFGLVIAIMCILCLGSALFGYLRNTEEEGLYDFSSKTDTFIPRNFGGDYASSSWNRPQPSILGTSTMTSGMVTQDAITQRPSIDGQYTEAIHSIEMNQFTNTANDNILQSTISEPPQYDALVEPIDQVDVHEAPLFED